MLIIQHPVGRVPALIRVWGLREREEKSLIVLQLGLSEPQGLGQKPFNVEMSLLKKKTHLSGEKNSASWADHSEKCRPLVRKRFISSLRIILDS